MTTEHQKNGIKKTKPKNSLKEIPEAVLFPLPPNNLIYNNLTLPANKQIKWFETSYFKRRIFCVSLVSDVMRVIKYTPLALAEASQLTI